MHARMISRISERKWKGNAKLIVEAWSAVKNRALKLMSQSERQWERMKWNWDDNTWDKMRGNDNKWGGMKMAFGKWEKKWKYDYAGSEIKKS